MEYIKVHTFTTEQEAQQAIDLINEGEGIPVSPDAITRTYCTYEVAENTIFIRADEVTQKYIETTTEITIE